MVVRSPLQQQGENMLLTVHVQPNAARTELVGLHGESLKVRLHAPPVDGQANAELCRFIADVFGVRRQAVTVLSGASSRQKRLCIEQVHVVPAIITTILEGI